MKHILPLLLVLCSCSAATESFEPGEPAPIPTRVAQQPLPNAQDAGTELPAPTPPAFDPHAGWHLAHGGDCWLPDDPAAGGLCACSEGRPCTYDCGHYADGTPWVATQCCDVQELMEGKRFPDCG